MIEKEKILNEVKEERKKPKIRKSIYINTKNYEKIEELLEGGCFSLFIDKLIKEFLKT